MVELGEKEEDEEALLAYERLLDEPIVVTSEGPFITMARKITAWVQSDIIGKHQRLRVGAVWGGRGTGKTSILLTVLDQLRRTGEAGSDSERERKADRPKLRLPAVETEEPLRPWPLFEPATVLDGERLIFHLLEFVRVWYLRGTEGEGFSTALEHEAKALTPERFLNYLEETATSKEALEKETVKFLSELGARSNYVRKNIRQSLSGLGRIVLFVDDLDLQPQRAYDLLHILYAYFRDVDMVVVLAADQEQFLASIDASLKKSKIANAGLGGQILVKHVAAEWRLPIPSSTEKRDFFDQVHWSKSKPGHRWFTFDTWWKGFRAPQQPGDVAGGEARSFFAEAAPTTWRGLKRLYNRAVSLEELHGSVHDLNIAYHDAVGSSLGNVSSFLALVLAIDESFPELLLFQSFEEQPSRLQRGLTLAGAASFDGEDDIKERQDREYATSWNIGDEEARLFPVRDRLLDPKVISGRRRGHAEELLRRLGNLWQRVWKRSAEEEGGERSLLTVSVSEDAKEKARRWWERFVRRADDVSHIDLRDLISGSRPTPTELRAVLERLEGAFADTRMDDLQLFTLAPLPVAAWIGWYSRYARGLKVVGYDRDSDFLVFSPARHEQLEQRLIFFGEPVRVTTEQTDAPSVDAAVILDVRRHPDRSTFLLPFRDSAGKNVCFKLALKLVCEPGFHLESDDEVGAIIHDLCIFVR